MKYKNGKDIFPAELLQKIQQYVAGGLVYIPARESKKSWGETSGYKQYLRERNAEICRRFSEGLAAEELADMFFLSPDTIRKIVYGRKEEAPLEYHCSLQSAMEYGAADRLEEWVHQYLLSDGCNKDFSDGLKLFDRTFFGPVKMSLSLFSRCCGPEEGMKYRIDPVWFEKHVEELMEVLQSKKDMPPLIAHYVEGGFELNDGNHRLEAYRRLGIDAWYMIIWITEKEEVEEFLEKYEDCLQ